MTNTALILGQTGRFGRHATLAFREAGWAVRGFDRRSDQLSEAAQGADVIVNAWNPPYTDWAAQVPDLHAGVRAVARQTGATVILPGNVYVFGPNTPAPWSEKSPHKARNPLGLIRKEMEHAYRADGTRTINLRCGDFLDTTATDSWFDRVMVKSLQKGILTYPGNPKIDHAWAFLPDVARALVQLATLRDALPDYADIPFPGYTLSGEQMAQHLTRITGRPTRVKRLNWLPLHLARPVWPLAKHLLEMRYLWDTPHSLDRERFDSLLPEFQPTPVERALAQAIRFQQVDAA